MVYSGLHATFQMRFRSSAKYGLLFYMKDQLLQMAAVLLCLDGLHPVNHWITQYSYTPGK